MNEVKDAKDIMQTRRNEANISKWRNINAETKNGNKVSFFTIFHFRNREEMKKGRR